MLGKEYDEISFFAEGAKVDPPKNFSACCDSCELLRLCLYQGEMPELAEGARLEIVCAGRLVPRVRIPLSPPFSLPGAVGFGSQRQSLVIAGSCVPDSYKSRQVRKEAAVVTSSGVAVNLAITSGC
jgi:hypothetical protein